MRQLMLLGVQGKRGEGSKPLGCDLLGSQTDYDL